jgi:hypothetical protein
VEAYAGSTVATHPKALGGDGVNGTGGISSTSNTRHGAGVRGIGGGASGTQGPGVVGQTNSFVHPAVVGVNSGGSSGVLGTSGGTGVRGISFGAASAGVEGIASGAGPGVWGFTSAGHAVLGNSQSGNGGVFSSSTGYGLSASTATGAVGVFAKGNPIAFQGHGNLTCTGTGHFNGGIVVATRLADGSTRGTSAVVSPETVIEDFGRARLANGVARVELEPMFAQMAAAADYSVFLTPNGDCRGLYVAEKSAAGFTVRELQGGSASLEFDYRVVARRTGSQARARFAIVDEPPPAPSFPAMPTVPSSMADLPVIPRQDTATRVPDGGPTGSTPRRRG